MSKEELVELLGQPTVTVSEAGQILGLSRNGTYEAVRRGDLEVMKFGKRIIVPTAPLRRKLGLVA
jgi:excisionase family DNA binding protein